MLGHGVAWYLLNSTIEGDIPVLLVHVVVASTGLISHPHTVVFDLGGVLLSDLQCQSVSDTAVYGTVQVCFDKSYEGRCIVTCLSRRCLTHLVD